MITERESDTLCRGRRQVKAMSIAAIALALTAAGCGSDSGGSTGSVAAPRATGDAVSAQATSLGTILVDGKGRTVYDFANDTSTESTCTDAACVASWPFVPAPASLPASLPGLTGKLGTTTRPGGALQLTVAGHPVYTFVGDSAPGQTNGEGLNLNGGVWSVVSPAGAPITDPGSAGVTQGPIPGY